MISEIIARTCRSSMLDFANKYLFEPLDIEKYESYIADNRENHLSYITARESQGRKWLCDKKGNAAAGYSGKLFTKFYIQGTIKIVCICGI